MTRIVSRYRDLEYTWRYGLVGGLLSLPVTTASYWETGSTLSLSAVFFGGLLAGYLAHRRTSTARGVGVRVGLVGAVPSVWIGYDILTATSALAGPPWFVASGIVMAVVAVLVVCLFAFGFGAAVGELGARIGGRFDALGSAGRGVDGD